MVMVKDMNTYLTKPHAFVPEILTLVEGLEGGLSTPFPTCHFSNIPAPVGFLLEIPVFKIPVNKNCYLSVERTDLSWRV